MVSPERSEFILTPQSFVERLSFDEPEKAPRTVIAQTDQIIGLSNRNVVEPKLRNYYLSTYTLPFLDTAAKGADRAFDRTLSHAFTTNDEEKDVNEAAGVAGEIFGWMRILTDSNLVPTGYSKNGMLRVPENPGEFKERLREMKIQLALLVSDMQRPAGFFNIEGLRTSIFFRVGSRMPLGFRATEREERQYSDHVAARLLKGIKGLS